MSAAVCALIAGSLQVISPGPFTLAWQHSVEHIRWEEDWQVQDRKLVIGEARVRGNGAGMEIPPDAVLRKGSWHYKPRLAPQASVQLTNSANGGNYQICRQGSCRVLPATPGPLILRPCPQLPPGA